MKYFKSSFREILNLECKKDGKGRFKTTDVIRVAERTYNEQQATISTLKNHLNNITRVEKK
jgi:hypothetical protein